VAVPLRETWGCSHRITHLVSSAVLLRAALQILQFVRTPKALPCFMSGSAFEGMCASGMRCAASVCLQSDDQPVIFVGHARACRSWYK